MRNDILTQANAIRASMDSAGALLTDQQAAAAKDLYPFWDEKGVDYYDGTDGEHPQSRVRGRTSNRLYKCTLPHTSQSNWPPENTPAMWTTIDVDHAGTIEDPVPAARGMEYTYGLYYLEPEDKLTYLCKRGEETGAIVLQYLPHELVGSYFELAEVIT